MPISNNKTSKSSKKVAQLPFTFYLVPKEFYKSVLQYPYKLYPTEAAIISSICQKYSIVSKVPSNNKYLSSIIPKQGLT